MHTVKQVTKEWYRCKPFEKVLSTLWEENPGTKFKRHELLDRINRGDFGDNLVASNTPNEKSVEDMINEYRKKGQEWLDIQDLTYHYSHFSPNSELHSKIKMLVHVSGSGDTAVYKLRQEAFISN
jgi:hypothetical protein